MIMDLTKKYSNGEVTIVWKPALCIHSGNCWRGLHEVFHPEQRPWITPEGSTTERIIAQVNKCPSGALSFYYNEAEQPDSLTSD
ncbi:MAG TPA: (4Fe-4S)-binding protein [Saprospiraceae bacterium]|nr:(4Fe-4S)-binding protein [Saprospiraceae bacterium]